ncbi:hypothetical protein Tsubulata_045775 [Turnera subulata]|uniref:Uncharacterized protein n=1 Tax=Turnera subulata TaxID=218843 RepID=A0A9Q0J3R9_9ROSI|nr:hypothetical protein Tsubulata_045775 [Turnera subulata]
MPSLPFNTSRDAESTRSISTDSRLSASVHPGRRLLWFPKKFFQIDWEFIDWATMDF